MRNKSLKPDIIKSAQDKISAIISLSREIEQVQRELSIVQENIDSVEAAPAHVHHRYAEVLCMNKGDVKQVVLLGLEALKDKIEDRLEKLYLRSDHDINESAVPKPEPVGD